MTDDIKIGSLFSGIGGLELGLEGAGAGKIVWQVEKERFCLDVLTKHWPSVVRYDDVRTVGEANLERVSVICGGSPCQSVSLAGGREGFANESKSGLWREYRRIVAEIRPDIVFVENVTGLSSSSRGWDFGEILSGLATLGYDAVWDRFKASDVGAPHKRERVFILAYLKGSDTIREYRRRAVADADGLGDSQRHPEASTVGAEWDARPPSVSGGALRHERACGEADVAGGVADTNDDMSQPRGRSRGMDGEGRHPSGAAQERQWSGDAVGGRCEDRGRISSEIDMDDADGARLEGYWRSVGADSLGHGQSGLAIDVAETVAEFRRELADTSSERQQRPREYAYSSGEASDGDWEGIDPVDGDGYGGRRSGDGDISGDDPLADTGRFDGHRRANRSARVIGEWSYGGRKEGPSDDQRGGSSEGEGHAEPSLGGEPSRVSSGLDGHERAITHGRWPSGPNAAQKDWEAPRVATKIKDRAARLKALGNAVVPQVACLAWKVLLDRALKASVAPSAVAKRQQVVYEQEDEDDADE